MQLKKRGKGLVPVSGGASYDALVAATAASHGAELVRCDRRAVPVSERYGVRVHLV